MCKCSSVFLTIPKPLKQYTLFKKHHPFRSPSCSLCPPACKLYKPEEEPEVDKWAYNNSTLAPNPRFLTPDLRQHHFGSHTV